MNPGLSWLRSPGLSPVNTRTSRKVRFFAFWLKFPLPVPNGGFA